MRITVNIQPFLRFTDFVFAPHAAACRARRLFFVWLFCALHAPSSSLSKGKEILWRRLNSEFGGDHRRRRGRYGLPNPLSNQNWNFNCLRLIDSTSYFCRSSSASRFSYSNENNYCFKCKSMSEASFSPGADELDFSDPLATTMGFIPDCFWLWCSNNANSEREGRTTSIIISIFQSIRCQSRSETQKKLSRPQRTAEEKQKYLSLEEEIQVREKHF